MSDLFEDFALGPHPYQATGAPDEDALESFDRGYKAGWDDASNAHSESQTKASSILIRNLEAIDFKLVEARGLILAALAPVLNEIAATLLPDMASQSLRSHLVSELETLLQNTAPDNVEIEVSLTDKAAIQALLAEHTRYASIDVKVRDTLAEGQINISNPDLNHRIDIRSAISQISDSLKNFETHSTQQPEQAHAG